MCVFVSILFKKKKGKTKNSFNNLKINKLNILFYLFQEGLLFNFKLCYKQ